MTNLDPSNMTYVSTMAAPAEADLMREGWQQRRLQGGEILWQQSAPADELAWVSEGQLEATIGDTAVARIETSELLGEVSAFLKGERRTARIQALRETRLLVLSSAQLQRLRAQEASSYDWVLRRALATMAERIERASERLLANLASLPTAVPALEHENGGALATPPTVPGLLARLRGLPDVESSVVAQLAELLVPRFLESGSTLYHHAESGRALSIVAAGLVALERDGKELGLYGPGAVIEPAAFFRGTPHLATAVARHSCWVYQLSHEQYRRLEPITLRSVGEVLVYALREQLLSVEALLAQTTGPRGNLASDEAFKSLRPLASWRDVATTVDIAPSMMPTPPPVVCGDPEKEALLAHIRESIIGGNEAMWTPFGLRRMTYADYTASGRGLRFVEDFIRSEVLPLYANTHTEASASGLQTTHFREEARAIVGTAVNAGPSDAVIFVGSGATGAINRLVDILNMRLPCALDAKYGLSDTIPAAERPVVLIGPYEHHSNILPWRHSLAELYVVPLNNSGQLDLTVLEQLLQRFLERPLVIGSFSAASNVTGVATDTVAVASLLHRYGALSFWDYAAAGPYVKIDMNPSGPGVDHTLAYKDAVFLSPHKFIGGPGTPGLLVLKRSLGADNPVPSNPGGGTVDYVWDTGREIQPSYAGAIEVREEAGTPAIVESIRCGLAFQLKEQVGADTIQELEGRFVRGALESWAANPAIRTLGPREAERLSITSFMVKLGHAYVHHNFVVAVLNDVFGIQARGGCSCAGPYGALLLGIDERRSTGFIECVDNGFASLKPGWARVNFNYFISNREFRYIVEAIHLVALQGWALLPDYRLDPVTGLWKHQNNVQPELQELARLRFDATNGKMGWPSSRHTLLESALERHLEDGKALLARAATRVVEIPPAPDVPEFFEEFRWFPMPHEVAQYLALKNGGRSKAEL